jgi:GT2 family glycosyltransferase
MSASFREPLVSITIVTHNSRRYIAACLEAVFAQEYRPLEVVLVDNGSSDGTRELLRRFEHRAVILANAKNVGFAAGQNQAIRASRGDWVLTLNPDVRLAPGFISRLLAAADLDDGAGVLCGKLLRAAPDLGVPAEPRIDSAGICFTADLRHFDRGWNHPDNGHFAQLEYVFGATGAAALYRREMIVDVALPDGFFDPDFFTYREDADVAWRAQLLGWRCLYVPDAVGWHVRRAVQSNRHALPAVLRMHSVKNRFLMRINNLTGNLYRRCWLETSLRDLVVMGGCILREPSSLPAFWHLGRALPRAWAKRRHIMARRRADDEYLAAWFRPVQARQPGPRGTLVRS